MSGHFYRITFERVEGGVLKGKSEKGTAWRECFVSGHDFTRS
jgi:hypothetical protein